jgi:hypothetical protein
MLATIYAHLCVPGRLRFVLRWLAELLLFLAQLMALVLVAWAVFRLIEQRGGFLNPQPHQPFSPDFINYHPRRIVAPRRERES